MGNGFCNVLCRHCAPAMAGVKPACIVTLKKQAGLCEKGDLADCCRTLYPFGKRCRLLCETAQHLVWMVYDPALLEQVLQRPESRALLTGLGYEMGAKATLAGCLDRLADRMKAQNGFPHEIGLFLGYPPADVLGFICQGGKGYRLSGQWKVYGDVAQAQRLFAAYDACRDFFLRQTAAGKPLSAVLEAC